MRSIVPLVLVAGLTALACGGPSAPPAETASHQHQTEGHEQHGAADAGEHQMHEGAIGFSAQGQTYPTTVLGGLVGTDSVEQVKVGVYVLQAESAERLKSTGSGPTHIFNLTFEDERTEELIPEASGTVTVTGADGRQRSEEFLRFATHFQARLRLERPGDYQVRVSFDAAGRSGNTRPLLFTYRWDGAETEL